MSTTIFLEVIGRVGERCITHVLHGKGQNQKDNAVLQSSLQVLLSSQFYENPTLTG